MNELLNEMTHYIAYYVLPILIPMLSGFFLYYTLQKMRKNIKIAHNIAVIGFPKSGKTTLITSIFDGIMFYNVLSLNAVVRGEDTINKVNEDMEKLKIGKRLGATTDQDVFAYRFDMTKREFFYKKNVKVQIGDFPGEDSELFYNNFGPWLHKTPFFKWVMQADSFIFVIDIASVLLDNHKYKAQMIKSIIAAWQHIVEYHIESEKKIHRKSVNIVFTKSDLLLYHNVADYNKGAIHSLAFEENEKEVIHIRNEKELNTKKIEEDFADLKNYFSKQKIDSEFIFASHFVFDESEKSRLGIKKIICHSLK